MIEMLRTKENKYIIRTLIVIFSIVLLFSLNIVHAEDDTGTNNVTNQVSESYDLTGYVNTLNTYLENSQVDGIDIKSITQDLVSNKGFEYKTLISKFLGIFANEILVAIRGAIVIYIIIVLMGIIKSFELEKGSDITKIAHLVCFLTLSTVTIGTFVGVISIFKDITSTLTTIMQVISPFLMAILIATGAITSTGIIQPLLLFISSAIGLLVNYIVVPFLCISVAFNVICSISENLKLSRIAKLFPSVALWATGISLTVFLGVLSLETSLSSGVDALSVKTTQAVVSNFVPVVGKFFSDSFETVVGATKIVGKVGGTIGIIAIIVVSLIPIVKIASVFVVYSLLLALSEPVCSDESIHKYLVGFTNVYKTLLGILIGVIILFVISTGIILNLASSVVT